VELKLREEVSIGLLGLGTVGTGVVKLLDRNQAHIRKRLGRGLRIAAVAVRHPTRPRNVALDGVRIVGDARRLIVDPAIDVIVELIGGIEPAKSLVLGAIGAGKDVVTANKALLATHGQEVFQAAERAGVRLGFEGSVAGGIPIIRVLRQALAGERNRAIYGIVNGTCNSILTAMTDRGAEFHEALAEAQEAGLAEADPSLDVDGTDAAQKLSLLVMLAFGARCPVSSIHTEGIRRVGQLDVAFARELGYVIKLLAIAKDDGRSIEARVHPTMIPRGSLLADVRGAFNAVHVQGDALGPTLYVGKGAGMMPTATSVLADILDVAEGRRRGDAPPAPPLGMPWRELRRARVRPIGGLEAEYYLRFLVLDRPGVLGRIAGILGRNQISIASVIQKDRKRGTSVPIVIRTHDALERNLMRALAEIGRLTVVSGKPVFVRIEDRL
jgi:homoserine dehydrogenase